MKGYHLMDHSDHTEKFEMSFSMSLTGISIQDNKAVRSQPSKKGVPYCTTGSKHGGKGEKLLVAFMNF